MKKILIAVLAAVFVAVPAAALAQDTDPVEDEEVGAYVQPPTTTEPGEVDVQPPVTTVPEEVDVQPPPATVPSAPQPPPTQAPLPSTGLSTLETSLRVGALLLIGGLGVVIVARRRRYSTSLNPAA